MDIKKFERRMFFQRGLKMAGALAAVGFSSAHAQTCRLTSQQPEGPFYPVDDQSDKNNDLTQINGHRQSAVGEVVTLKGRVLDQECRPIWGALVDIWQACHTGKYNHPGDPNSAELDPNFQYWGQCLTNKNGEYEFKTIKPGAYPAGEKWIRPPHIHVKVHYKGHEELTTQLYFKEEVRLNSSDHILQDLTQKQREDVIVDFKKVGRRHRTGHFDISLYGPI